ncbi:MAG: branched-chain amino acid ABC transporter substrate-binding protein [Chloroflexi bacterium]|nr:branched-chain amino acid ABC transporter substrate-binding protein [Chloroflexota bacterium]
MLRKNIAFLLVGTLILIGCGDKDNNEGKKSAPTATTPREISQPEACTQDALGCTMIVAGNTIKIGTAAPLTGDSASIGIAFSQATQVAIAIANENSLNGFLFAQIDENDQGTPEGGAEAATRLVTAQSDGLVAVVGHAFSGASRAATPIYEAAGIPMMSPTATNPNLTQTGSKVFNRVIFNDNAQGVLMAKYLFQILNIRKLAILHDDSIYSTQLAEVTRDEFESSGGEVVIVLEVPDGADPETYANALIEVEATQPEAIFFPGYTPEVAAVVNSLQDSTMQDIVFAGSDGVNPQTFIELTGNGSEGIYLSGESEPPESDQKTLFDTSYKETFGVEPGIVSRSVWDAFDAANILIQAVRKVAILGSDGNLYIPRQALVDTVRGTTDYVGASGQIACDETGECNMSGPDIMVIQNGELVPVPLASLKQ